MLLLLFWTCISTLYFRPNRTWCVMIMMLINQGVGFPIVWIHFWIWANLEVVLSDSLKNYRRLKFWTTRYALVWNVISHSILITYNHRIFIFHRWNNWFNIYLRYTNTTKVKYQVLLGVIHSDELMYLVLIWDWGMMDAWNILALGVSWRLRIWSQDGQDMTFFDQLIDRCDIICLVYGMIDTSWKELVKNPVCNTTFGQR